jgi:hypothetical protein
VSARGHERKRSAHLVLDICETDGEVDGEDDEDDVALRIAQWPQSIILLLPRRVPECNLNNLAIKLSVCYVVLENGGYIRLGKSELLPRRSRHGGNILLEICCARRRLTGTFFHTRLATTRRDRSGAIPNGMLCSPSPTTTIFLFISGLWLGSSSKWPLMLCSHSVGYWCVFLLSVRDESRTEHTRRKRRTD